MNRLLGKYDIIIKLESDDLIEFKNNFSLKICKIPHIRIALILNRINSQEKWVSLNYFGELWLIYKKCQVVRDEMPEDESILFV